MNYFQNKLHIRSLTVFRYASALKRKRLKNLTKFTKKNLLRNPFIDKLLVSLHNFIKRLHLNCFPMNYVNFFSEHPYLGDSLVLYEPADPK